MSPIGSLIVGPLAAIMGITTIFLLSAFLGISITILMYTFSVLRKLDFDTIIYTNSNYNDNKSTDIE
jgi:hypothetical protein